jgi:tetratricopeptide (TPR) repeat protein
MPPTHFPVGFRLPAATAALWLLAAGAVPAADDPPDKTDRDLVARLEAIRLGRALDGGADAARRYAEAFRGYGLDVEKLKPDAAATLVRKAAVREALIAAMDDWSAAAEAKERERLRAVLDQADPDPARVKVREALAKGDRKALVALAAEAKPDDLPPALLVRLGQGLSAAGAPAEAVALLKAAQRRRPGDFWINLELAGLYSRQPAGAEDAVRFATAALALRPDSPEARLSLGAVLLARGKADEAAEQVREAIRLKPDLEGAHTLLGDILRALGRADEALDAYRKALSLDGPGSNASFRARLGLGNVLAEKGKLDEAEEVFREAVKLQPKAVEPQRNLAGVLYRRGKVKEAEEVLRQVIEAEPASAETRADLGILLLHQGKLNGAVEALQAAIKLKPDLILAHLNLGGALRAQGKLDEAAAAFREALRLRPDAYAAHFNLAETLRDQGRLQDAVNEYQTALRLKPDLVEAWTGLGGVYRLGRAPDQAVAAFRKAVELKPDLAAAHCNLGLALRDQGDFKEALAALKRGHELGTKTPGWRHPSETWVRETEKLIELDAKLPDIVKGDAKPATAEEALLLADVCHRTRRLHGTAAKLFAQAFADRPALAEDPNSAPRLPAAAAATLAGFGVGKDAEAFDDKTRTAMRLQAQEWLKEDLALCAKRLEDDAARPTARRALQRWLAAPELAAVRDKAALERLPAEERKDWQKLWDDAAELLKASDKK